MAEQIASSDNTKKLLLEGNGPKETPRARPIPQQKRGHTDVVVENAMEKRYLWTARAFAVIFAVSLCCNLILTYVIMTTIPLYRVEPYLLSFADKEEQIYHIEQVSKINQYKYLTELFVREYVLLRNAFVNDIDEMERRWGKDSTVREMSSPGIYKKFRAEFADKAMELIRQQNASRSVKIVSVTEVAGGKEGQTWWQVEFRTSDMDPTKEAPKIRVWVAAVGIRYIAKQVKFGERLKNPLGFTVTDFKVVERK